MFNIYEGELEDMSLMNIFIHDTEKDKALWVSYTDLGKEDLADFIKSSDRMWDLDGFSVKKELNAYLKTWDKVFSGTYEEAVMFLKMNALL